MEDIITVQHRGICTGRVTTTVFTLTENISEGCIMINGSIMNGNGIITTTEITVNGDIVNFLLIR
jgi:hypothetical protein